MVRKLEDGRSHATAFTVGLILDENENTYQNIKLTTHREEGKQVVDLPNGNEDLILHKLGECTQGNVSRHITGFHYHEIDGNFSRSDSPHVHLPVC